MSNKKRTKVKTVETREVWIIRKVVPEPIYEAHVVTQQEMEQSVAAVPSTTELNDSSETRESNQPRSERRKIMKRIITTLSLAFFVIGLFAIGIASKGGAGGGGR